MLTDPVVGVDVAIGGASTLGGLHRISAETDVIDVGGRGQHDGQPIADFIELTAAIADKIGGDQVVIEVLRGGESIKVNVTLGQWQ